MDASATSAQPGGSEDLRVRARQILIEHGFDPDFPSEALHAIEAEHGAATAGATTARTHGDAGANVRDLRTLLWSSIDNRESRDLDQVELCEERPGGDIRCCVGIADVDHLVKRGSPLDVRAAANTTSVYTGVETYPMLPERLSTDLTSLNEGAERLAIVIGFLVDTSGDVRDVAISRALVVNHAKLAYEPVGAWLGGAASAPHAATAIAGLETQIRLQHEAAGRLRQRRFERGALDLETIEARPVMSQGTVVALEVTRKNPARDLIEDFMIATNVAMAQFLEQRHVASIRRIVRVPERWDRIVALARTHGAQLPEKPDGAVLAAFLQRQRAEQPDHFADVSLAVVKLLGPGEYAVERPWEPESSEEGHFGLAVDDYSHSTAPNRRYADLVMQRLVKSTLAGEKNAPYSADELQQIAARCTAMENAERVVERQMRKIVAATLLAHRIGDVFDAIVTGVTPRGTFARLRHPPAEGQVVRGAAGLDVGERVRLKLVHTDAERGFVDFERVAE